MDKYKITMIVIDILALLYLIYQIITQSVYIPSYAVLLLCNFLVFFSERPKDTNNKSKKD